MAQHGIDLNEFYLNLAFNKYMKAHQEQLKKYGHYVFERPAALRKVTESWELLQDANRSFRGVKVLYRVGMLTAETNKAWEQVAGMIQAKFVDDRDNYDFVVKELGGERSFKGTAFATVDCNEL